MGGLLQALIFLLDAVAAFVAGVFLLRFLMQAARVSFGGSLGHFVITLTNWGVRPLRRIVPGVWGWDLSSLLAAWLVQLVFYGLMFGLLANSATLGAGDWLPQILFSSLRGLLRVLIGVYVIALILQAVLSWVNPYSPLAGPVNQLTRPLLNPIRRVLPPIGGIDLSPLVVILLLQAVLIAL